MHDTYRDAGFTVLGVTDHPVHDAQRYANKHGMQFPVLANADDVREAYGVALVWGTVVFLVDPDGRVVARDLGDAEQILAAELGA